MRERRLVLSGFWVLAVLMAACSASGLTSSAIQPLDWKFVDADKFTLFVPPDWNFIKGTGIDSYVGDFSGDGVRLMFDYGRYSNSLAEDNDAHYSVTYEAIDGHRAKLVVPKTKDGEETGVYFADIGSVMIGSAVSFNLVGEKLTKNQQETAILIFRTLKFKP